MPKTIDLGAMTILLGLSSAMLAGCEPAHQNEYYKVCVDAQGRRVDDGQCSGGASGHGGWAYYSGGRRVPALGEAAVGASMAPAEGASYGSAPSEGVARGGFGATGEGHGGGEGGAGE